MTGTVERGLGADAIELLRARCRGPAERVVFGDALNVSQSDVHSPGSAHAQVTVVQSTHPKLTVAAVRRKRSLTP